MHAYLLIGTNVNSLEEKIEEYVKKLSAKRLNFNASKIDDIRQIGEFTKLKIPEPTAIVIKNIDSATEEALNAFLKNLEEPQDSLYYILHANSDTNLLATIISRCSVIRLEKGESKIDDKLYQKFINESISEKFIALDKIKARDEAISFVEDFIIYLSKNLKNGYVKNTQLLKVAQNTLASLKANGNVALQLNNFAIQMSKISAD